MTHVSSAVRPSLHGQTAKPITPQIIHQKSSYPFPIMHCEVVFGSPSMNCNGTGICRITGTNSIKPLSQKKDCRVTFGQISAAPNGKVSLFFFREQLCIHLYRQHFHKGTLTLTEACPLPMALCKALNIEFQQVLPGNYTVMACDGHFRVDLDCE